MPMRRRFLIDWALLALSLPLGALWVGQRPSVMDFDLKVYDSWVSLSAQAPSSDILLVSIDGRSLGELGPWPWARGLHAQLLERLASHAPRAVLLDLFLDEPSTAPADDDRLAAAMRRVPTYLPMRHGDHGTGQHATGDFLEPLPEFARNAKGVGHADANPDPDGIVRRLFRRVGVNGDLRPYVGWLIASSGGPAESVAPVRTRDDGWSVQAPFGVPLAGPHGTYRGVPYVSVLRGEVPSELLRDKILLVGAVTSSLLGDEVPVAGVGPQLLPGIEMHANAIDALLHARAIGFAQGWTIVVWTVVPIWIVLLSFLRAAKGALAIASIAALGCIAISAAALTSVSFWLPPTAPVLGIGATYLLWSWRRLNALLNYFRERADALNAVPTGAFELETSALQPTIDEMAGEMRALDHAISRLSQMQALLNEGMWHLPVAVLVCQHDGSIGQSNAEARMLLAPTECDSDMSSDPLRGQNLLRLLQDLDRLGPVVSSETTAKHLSRGLSDEYTTPHGKTFRLRAAPLGEEGDATRAWVIVLRDLTSERIAQRNREQWLGFLSHDLRSPQVSILSLLALREQDDSKIDESRLIGSVRREAIRTLALAEAFMDMAEADSDRYHFADTQAGAIVLDAVDSVWAYAVEKGVSLTSTLSDRDLLIYADTALLTRALINLLSNAIRHSEIGSTVHICVDSAGGSATEVVVAVRDEGDGIAPDRLLQLLLDPRPDQRATPEVPAQVARSRGLGMAVVHAVVKRHGGWIDGHSAPGAGTTFLIGVPLLS
jgi:CHASE2 domain-containing sensor protein/signal transduction histidine kinase